MITFITLCTIYCSFEIRVASNKKSHIRHPIIMSRLNSHLIFSMIFSIACRNSLGIPLRPRRDLSWVVAMVTAAAEVKALITGNEMKEISMPKFNKPIRNWSKPATRVIVTASPGSPDKEQKGGAKP